MSSLSKHGAGSSAISGSTAPTTAQQDSCVVIPKTMINNNIRRKKFDQMLLMHHNKTNNEKKDAHPAGNCWEAHQEELSCGHCRWTMSHQHSSLRCQPEASALARDGNPSAGWLKHPSTPARGLKRFTEIFQNRYQEDNFQWTKCDSRLWDLQQLWYLSINALELTGWASLFCWITEHGFHQGCWGAFQGVHPTEFWTAAKNYLKFI